MEILNLSDGKIKIIQSEYGGWAYQIYMGTEVFISQHHIPAITMLKGFQSKKEACKVANLVVERIENNEIPTININDLTNLNITF